MDDKCPKCGAECNFKRRKDHLDVTHYMCGTVESQVDVVEAKTCLCNQRDQRDAEIERLRTIEVAALEVLQCHDDGRLSPVPHDSDAIEKLRLQAGDEGRPNPVPAL